MLRQPLISRAQRGLKHSKTASVPAPISGWDAKSSEADMPETFAVWLENWWPGTADVSVRKGAVNHVTGIGAAVRTLMAYNSPTAQKLFAATPTDIYNVTASGAVGASVNTITNGDFCYTCFAVPGGSYLVAVNGVDKLRLYNGTTWAAIDGVSTPAITGLATTSLANVCAFKRRLWFVEKDSMSAWYLPVDQIGGALTEFPLGQLFSKGGKLLSIANWTIDGGNGVDDYCAFITTEGECAVYKGSDPSTSTDWALVGVYFVGAPISKRCTFKYGGDLLILTQTGLVPLSKALLSATSRRSFAVSDKIDSVFNQSASSYGSLYGWSGIVFPKENLLLVNVPTVEDTSAVQFSMNTITNAWCLFSGWNAICWEMLGDELYFGGDGYVAQAMIGNNDFGTNITAIAKTAYNYFKSSAIKHFKLLRPLLKTSSAVSVETGLDTDFQSDVFAGAIAFSAPQDSIWETALWDEAIWGADYSVKKDWRTVFSNGGFCASVRLRIASKDIRISWSSTDFLYQEGGIL